VAFINHEHLNTFVAVADNHSMSKAAEKLNLSQPTISKHIRILEAIIGAKLIATSPRGAVLTEEGEKFIEFARSTLQQYDSVRREIKDNKNSLEGELTVISSRFGIHTLVKNLEEFKKSYPQIDLYINYDDYPKLIRGALIPGIYVGITDRFPLSSTSLIWREFGHYGFYPYAHSSYLQRFGLPKTWDDLDQHRLIGYKWSEPYSYLKYKESNPLLFLGRTDDTPRNPYVVIDDIEVCRVIIENGQGIGMLPPFLAQGNGFLPLFTGEYDPSWGIVSTAHYVIKPDLKSNMRVRKFIDFISDTAKSEEYTVNKIWGRLANMAD
jgi:DNA-binding transcriptional LysR family regulator